MAEKVNEDQVSELLAILRKDVPIDAKVQQVNGVKSSIKQHNVPDECVPLLFEALRTASTAQHAALVNAGFTALNHLLTRLSRQEPKLLNREAKATLPVLVDKLGDQKDKMRTIGVQSLITMHKAVPQDVDRYIRNTAMAGKNPRAKESGMHWLLQMHKEHGLQFRAYVPTLMELLEDADGMVRDAAKTTVIELFRTAPNSAKSDLKKQLKNFKVRPAIEQAIVKELAPAASAVPSDLEPRPESARSVRPVLAASVSSLASERPVTPMLPESRPDQVEPTYVNTQRELDEIIREMHQHFDGRETEQNWLKREESITKLRRLLAGNAATDFPDPLLAGVRGLLDGIIKAVTSLRTSLSKEGCSLVQDLAVVYGPGIDPMVELLMQTFIKLSAATKKISSQLANVTIDTIIGRVSYTPRIMQHVWGASQDKNIQPRSYATGWLKTLVKKEAGHKGHLEHSGGLDLIEKSIKKGLADPNPGVREKMRSTYWTFAGVWPARAEGIMVSLDATAQKLLQRDANNPNSPKPAEGGVRPGLGLSKSTMGAKPSLREAMIAQKKALNERNLPARPGSAMAHFNSPARTVSGSSSSSGPAMKPAVRPRQEQSALLSGAPMRRAATRPPLTARPATAGPYSVRTHDAPSREQTSPGEKTRPTAVTPKSTISASPRRTAPRTRPGHAATASEGSVPTPSKATAAGAGKPSAAAKASPRVSPAKARAGPPQNANRSLLGSSPEKANEDLTLVVPTASETAAMAETNSEADSTAPAVPLPAPDGEEAQAPEALENQEQRPPTSTPLSTPSRALKVFEDPSSEDQTTPRPVITRPVLEDRPINEDAAALSRPAAEEEDAVPNGAVCPSPDKAKQNSRLLDSGIAKVTAQTLEVHGFRKLQAVLRDGKTPVLDDKFDALLMGLFEFLQSPLAQLAPEKAADVKVQILSTIKLLLRRSRDSFQPHVSRGLESLLEARCYYEARTHVVSGMEVLAEELLGIGDASEIALVLSRRMQDTEMDIRGCRSLSLGLHVLATLIDLRGEFVPSEAEVDMLGGLAARCLESAESGVRMDAVQLCVALHARVGDVRFWEALRGVKEDPKSLITYYIVKRQREQDATGVVGAGAVAAA